MNRHNSLLDSKKKYLVNKQKCAKECKLNKSQENFWELPKKELTLLSSDNKVNFTKERNGFFGWISSIFKR